MAPKKAQAPVAADGKLRPKRAAVTKSTTTTTTANTAKKRNAKSTAAPKTKATTAKTQAKKPAASKKTAAPKTAAGSLAAQKASVSKTSTTANTSKKRKADTEADDTKAAKKGKAAPRAEPVKRPVKEPKKKVLQKGPVITEPPKDVLDVLVFGEGSAGELGLGTRKNAVDVKRPRLNANLNSDEAAVVQLSAGAMHVVALTADNRVLTWGVNDNGALGRDTEWDGGLVDADAAEKAEDEDSDDDDDDSGLNPREATPTEIDLSTTELAEGTNWSKVVAGDSCTLALTDDGKVYGCGTFRGNEGPFGFTADAEVVRRFIIIEELKNIVDIACGANHALALDNKGVVFAWGAGEQNQLGRKIVERNKRSSLLPREVGMPRGAKKQIKKVFSGPYHSFAITHNDELYAWGLNATGQTGVETTDVGESGAIIPNAQHVKVLAGKGIVSVAGGSHHTIVATADGECLTWGRIDAGQLGFTQAEFEAMSDDAVKKNEHGKPGALLVPTRVTRVEGHASIVSAGPEHSLVVTKEGKAYSCGFSANYQTGLGTDDEVWEMTLIDNTAVKSRILNGVSAGAQFSTLTAQRAMETA
ncbi:hypothetical protein AMS68_000534 [Peltaster fructicola]|uniref:RCC1-like domain-containing protein n=1 Tax=Peltaster fructicola TaxID=286661 RepID=A0A6H0XJV9_9PEZI|nr:hypothetical protein AMS68_000534 [Peltaster fructicola]